MKHLISLIFLIFISLPLLANAQEMNDKELCMAGNKIENANACRAYGEVLNQDKSNPENTKLSLDYFIRACQIGEGTSCTIGGYILYHGLNNIEKDWATAFPMLARACDAGVFYNSSCFLSAKIIFDNTAVKFEVKDGVYLADKGCGGGDAKACRLLTTGYIYGENGIAKDKVKSHPYAVKACELEDGWACYIAGEQLSGKTDDFERNGQVSLQLLDRACSLGQFAACHNAGIQVSSGNELGNDMERASNYFVKACTNGTEVSCYSAGHLKVLLEEYDVAFPLLSKICEVENHPEACLMAAISVVELEGPSASRPWYNKGCDLGNQESCIYINELDRYEREQAEYDRIYAAQMAERAAGSARVTEALNAGNYATAMDIATYGIGSRADVSRVVLAADRAGALSQIDPFYFTFLETWLSVDYQQANAVVRREYLKNPDGVKPSDISSRGAATVASGPTESSLSDQFFQNQKDTYRRQLDWANRGGNPAGFSVNRN